MGIETLIGVGGSLLSSMSASDAADSQAAGTAQATAENRRQFDLTRQDYAPARNIGNNALRRLAALYGLSDGGAAAGSNMTDAEIRAMLAPKFTTQPTKSVNPFPYSPREGPDSGVWGELAPAAPTVDQAGLDAAVQERMGQQTGGVGTAPQTYNDGLDGPIEMDPGYQFGLDQDNQALDRKIAAAGGRVSGAAIKQAQRYGTDYATSGYQAAYGRRQDRLNRLQALAGIGQTATAGSAQAGDAAAGRNANLYSAQGNAAGAASLAQGNIWQGAANQLGAIGQRWAQQPSGPSNAQLAQTYGFG